MKLVRICLLMLSLLYPLGAEPQNLVLDGDFSEVPSPDKLTNVQNHANAWIWMTPVIPGWELSGTTNFVFIKDPSRRGLDICQGSASQTIATIPGNSYRLSIFAFMNQEFRRDCRLNVTCAGQTFHFLLAPEGHFEANFVAKSTQTRLLFSGAGDLGGPRLSQVRCVGFDPAARKLMDQFVASYQAMDRGEKSERDLAGLTAVLAPDFSWQPLEGSGRDRASYEELVRLHWDKKFKVYTELLDAKPQTDGSVLVEVERRETITGDYGKIENSRSQWTHIWVKSGSGWLLKSAQQSH
jgi:hypothetical protein